MSQRVSFENALLRERERQRRQREGGQLTELSERMSRPAGIGSPRFRPIVNVDREDYERLMAEMTTPAAGYITPDRRGIDPTVLCKGYHWNLCRCLGQAQEWQDLKHHIDIIKFEY